MRPGRSVTSASYPGSQAMPQGTSSPTAMTSGGRGTVPLAPEAHSPW
ncbi:hypothetical protein [Stigmatella erecta]|nr:hypothetical protein [Stigmatella erecta]